MRFDMTVSLGNIITIAMAIVAFIFAWRDLDWRVRNLEVWRKEQIEDRVARASLDTMFQGSVQKFEVAIATLNTKLAALDKEEERRIFGKRQSSA